MIFDITFCSRDCSNMNCKRNIEHLNNVKGEKIYSVAEFTNCKEYEQILTEADKLFINLGYYKVDSKEYILYELTEESYGKTIAIQKSNKNIHCRNNFGEFEIITPNELEALYKKYKEMEEK